MRSAVSARDGRFIALSVTGPGPFVREMLERRGARGLAVHHYAAPAGCELDDVKGWHAANPGLRTGIKSTKYMRAESARVKVSPGGPDELSRLRPEPGA